MIDRDSHPSFDQALGLAKQTKQLTVIPSYPCFEFWLLLHFGRTRKPYASAGANSAADLLIKDLRAKPGMNKYAKSGDSNLFEQLLGEPFANARKTAPRILGEAIRDNEMNPSTKIHDLMDLFEKLSAPQLV